MPKEWMPLGRAFCPLLLFHYFLLWSTHRSVLQHTAVGILDIMIMGVQSPISDACVGLFEREKVVDMISLALSNEHSSLASCWSG
ncbi:hypothetical protein DUNSADRAFT_13671 [Dunaliella salina]|uniref:Encoded protein n=1 Tax=Dunaliella salina TaxID=3046 RepID=A0ABQ7G8V3_DUNSA|nr:hypothetical protein DUNSADRAFT_13671 [Dunaliella salina]|eukprot:KAF5831040.1 hypothetical protein DUNSADRAFT_13671 [Dunaliella salina]